MDNINEIEDVDLTYKIIIGIVIFIISPITGCSLIAIRGVWMLECFFTSPVLINNLYGIIKIIWTIYCVHLISLLPLFWKAEEN